jgi:Secretion system C-terminal sorting domain
MKYTFKKIFLVILIVTCNSKFIVANDNEPLEILFIGSSYFNYNNLPDLFKNLTSTTGKDVFISKYAVNGMLLVDHANNPATIAKINERNWDFIILQGVGVTIAYPDYNQDQNAYPALVKLSQRIYNNCKSTRILFCLPWAFEDGMTWVQGWTDTYEDMQEIIYSNTIDFSNALGFTIAPVGWAWYQILDDKNYPLHYLHMSDWNHPNEKGSYIMACSIYSSIFLESTNEISYYADLTEEDAKYFQNVASNIVLDDTVLWNISTYIDTTAANNLKPTNIIDYSNNNKTILYQNFPNPFNSNTQIKYELDCKSSVKFEIFDLSGKKYLTINKQQEAGVHFFNFDGSKLKSDIYFYSITTNKGSWVKKMHLIK